jgi:hypothetical protein
MQKEVVVAYFMELPSIFLKGPIENINILTQAEIRIRNFCITKQAPINF